MLAPISFILLLTAMGTKKLLANSSCRYLARKCIEKSTEIPKAILKVMAVLGLKGIPANPISPAVTRIGMMLGISDMMIIFLFLNNKAMIADININAMKRLIPRFLIRKLFPLTKSKVVPVA